jgi:DNA-binding transcriptional regulator LsrR (DeoR family)
MRRIPDLTKLKAARLCAEGYSEDKIARVLGISSSTVNAAIGWAINHKRLERHKRYVFVPHGLSRAELDELDQIVSDSDMQITLQEAIDRYVDTRKGTVTPTVRVAPSGSRRKDSRGWNLRLERFGREMAPSIRQLIGTVNQAVGISWGASVASVVKGVETLQAGPLVRRKPIYFVPVCGEPLGAPLSAESCSNLSARMDSSLNRSQGHALSLSALPALIPVEEFTTAEDLQTLGRLFRRVKHYSDIFGQPSSSERNAPSNKQWKKPWLQNLDAVLCSVGPEDRVWGYRGDDLLQSGDLTREDLRELVLGDIAGVLIPQPGKWGSPKLAMIRDHWNGIQLEHLLGCARRAAVAKGVCGVCVVAIGSNKAAFLVECLGLRDDNGGPVSLINHLLVDDDLASALLNLLGPAQKAAEGLPVVRPGLGGELRRPVRPSPPLSRNRP